MSAPGDDTWLPAREQTPPHHWAPPGPPPAPQGPPRACRTPGAPEPLVRRTSPGHPALPGRSTARPSPRAAGSPAGCGRWCSVLALVIGLIGGVFGRSGLREPPLAARPRGGVTGGLDEAGTVSKAPLQAGNRSVASVAQRAAAQHDADARAVPGQEGRRHRLRASCSTAQGHVITNNHVVADAVDDHGPIEIVDQNGNKYAAQGRRPQPDLRPRRALREGRAGAAAGQPGHPRRCSASATRSSRSARRWG